MVLLNMLKLLIKLKENIFKSKIYTIKNELLKIFQIDSELYN